MVNGDEGDVALGVEADDDDLLKDFSDNNSWVLWIHTVIWQWQWYTIVTLPEMLMVIFMIIVMLNVTIMPRLTEFTFDVYHLKMEKW